MANVYNTGIQALCNGTIDWVSGTNMAMALVTSGYSFTAEDDVFADLTNEITNSGYTTPGQTIDNEATVLDDANDEVQLDCDNETWTSLAAGDLPDAAIIYLGTGTASTAQLLCYCSLTTPPAPNGGDYQIVINSEGVMEVSNV